MAFFDSVGFININYQPLRLSFFADVFVPSFNFSGLLIIKPTEFTDGLKFTLEARAFPPLLFAVVYASVQMLGCETNTSLLIDRRNVISFILSTNLFN